MVGADGVAHHVLDVVGGHAERGELCAEEFAYAVDA